MKHSAAESLKKACVGVLINGKSAQALVDSGSTHNFIHPDIVKSPYMSNTGNLTPMDKSTFRWFRWIHRTNVYSVGEVFFRWKINDVMTHGKQISVKLRLSDGSDVSIGQASLL